MINKNTLVSLVYTGEGTSKKKKKNTQKRLLVN